jgi:hypothetical protein
MSKEKPNEDPRQLSKKYSARITVSVVGERTSEVSPAPRHVENQSRSLRATMAALKNPKGHPNAPAGTNVTSKGSGLK